MVSSFPPMHSGFETEAFTLSSYPDYIFWVWTQTDTYLSLTEADLDDLRGQGWVEISDGAKPDQIRALYFARTQLTLTRSITQRGTAQFRLWVRSDDLQFGQQYPVQLAYTTRAQQAVPPNTPIDTTLVTPPPDMCVGTHALVEQQHETKRLSLYRLDQLGDQGQALFEQIQQAFTNFQPRAVNTANERGEAEVARLNVMSQIKADLWQKAQRAVKQLIILYWQLHLDTMKQRKSPGIPLAFRPEQPVALTPMPLAVQGVLAAYSNAQSGGKGWLQRQQVPTYLYSQEKESAQIEWRPATKLDLETLWKQIRSFSDLDGDVLLAVLAQWMSSRDQEGYVWIASDHILNYRGIQPRKYENTEGKVHLYHHRKEDLEAISASMDRIRDTHVTLQQWVKETPPADQPRRRGRRKKQAIQLESYIVVITEFLKQQELPSETAHDLTIAWKCRLGSCLEPFISGPNRQTAYLLQQALSYDPLKEFWEKRLARLVTFHLRMSAQGGSMIRQIRNIFEELSLPQNRSDPEKTRRRFEKALNRLQADEQISEWSYQESLPDLPAKKWFDVWLDFHVQIAASSLPLLNGPESEQTDATKP